MSTVELAPEDARQRVEQFVSRFGPGYRRLVRHAALPLVLTPELLHYLRNAFLRGQVPWVAEADLLLSDLCKEVGYEQYVMHPAVRARLITELRAEPGGQERVKEVARLLLQYLRRLERAGAGPGRDALLVQQWSALVYLDSDRVSREVHEALAAQVARLQARPDEVDALAALANITRNLAPQLDQNPELVALGREITDLLTGVGDPSGQQDGQEPHRIRSPGDLAEKIASAFGSWSDRGVQSSSSSDTDQALAQASAQAPSGPAHQPDVFICYSSADRKKVEELVQRLEAEGLEVCVDYRDMPVGESPQHWMEWQVEHCRHVLPVMTPNWLKSDWAAFEMMLAEDPTGRRHRLTPVLLEACDVPPRIKAVRNFANLADPTIADSDWDRLIKTLRGRGGPPAGPPRPRASHPERQARPDRAAPDA